MQKSWRCEVIFWIIALLIKITVTPITGSPLIKSRQHREKIVNNCLGAESPKLFLNGRSFALWLIFNSNWSIWWQFESRASPAWAAVHYTEFALHSTACKAGERLQSLVCDPSSSFIARRWNIKFRSVISKSHAWKFNFLASTPQTATYVVSIYICWNCVSCAGWESWRDVFHQQQRVCLCFLYIKKFSVSFCKKFARRVSRVYWREMYWSHFEVVFFYCLWHQSYSASHLFWAVAGKAVFLCRRDPRGRSSGRQ